MGGGRGEGRRGEEEAKREEDAKRERKRQMVRIWINGAVDRWRNGEVDKWIDGEVEKLRSRWEKLQWEVLRRLIFGKRGLGPLQRPA